MLLKIISIHMSIISIKMSDLKKKIISLYSEYLSLIEKLASLNILHLSGELKEYNIDEFNKECERISNEQKKISNTIVDLLGCKAVKLPNNKYLIYETDYGSLEEIEEML